MKFIEVFKKTKLIYIVIACMAQGIIKDGLSLWAPTILIDTHNLDLQSTIGYILIIPVLNLFGMWLANCMNKKFYKKEKITALILFGFSIVFLVLFLLFGRLTPLLTIILLGLTSSMMYGSNAILLGIIPLTYKKYNKTSSVAGLLDFASYVGAGLFTFVCGIVVSKYSWTYIVLFWISILMLATLMIYINLKKDKELYVEH
jgi:OPA family glycerol-3-phosphate transporter-like MFS transporter